MRKLPEFDGEFPVVTLGEEILTEGPGQIKALVTSAGNPVLSTPSGGELDLALASLEFFVAIDFYVNETTRHAHIILPPSSSLERGHYDLRFIFSQSATRQSFHQLCFNVMKRRDMIGRSCSSCKLGLSPADSSVE